MASPRTCSPGAARRLSRAVLETLEGRRLLSGTPATWTGAVDNSWSNAGNWVGNAVPTPGQDVIFPDSDGVADDNVEISSPVTVGSITLNQTVLNGSTITLQGNISESGNHASAIYSNIVLTQNATVSSTDLLYLPETISDGGNGYGLTITGSGVVHLSGSTINAGVPGNSSAIVHDTYTGETLIDGGRLGLGGTLTSSVVAENSGTFGVNGIVQSLTATSSAITSLGSYSGYVNQLDVDSGFSLDSASTLYAYLGGHTAGQYTQYEVAGGTINLAGASLSASIGYTPTVGNVITLIKNDTGNAIVGTFNGLPDNSVIQIGSYYFRVQYNGDANHDLLLTNIAHATALWTGAAGDGQWQTAGNWQDDVVPFPGQNISFAGTATTEMIGITSPVTVGSMTLGGAVLFGSTINLQGDITADPSHVSAILAPIALGANITATVPDALDFGGVISDGGSGYGIEFTGGGAVGMGGYVDTGTVSLPSNAATVASTYSGTTILNGDSLQLRGTLTSAVQAENGGSFVGSSSIGGLTLLNSQATPENTATSSPATLTLGNGLSLDNISTLDVSIASSTSYSSLIVNSGSIALGNAELTDLSAGDVYVTPGTVLTLIQNNGGQAISGTFSGLAEGATVTLAGEAYTISYVGGTSGHDVTLTAAIPPTDVFTNADGTSLWSDAGNWSFDAIPTAGEAVDFPAPGGSGGGGTQAIVTVDVAPTIGALELDNTVLDGTNTITLQGNVTTDANDQSAILDPVTLDQDTTLTVPSDLVLGGVIDDGGNNYGLTINGGGEVDMGNYAVISGAVTPSGDINETYSGTTALDGSILTVTGTLDSSVQANQGFLAISGGAASVSGTQLYFFAGSPLTSATPPVTLTGGLSLDGSSAFYEMINSSTGYSQLIVNGGSIDLGGAQLTGFADYNQTPALGDVLTLIQNNTGNPISGTFAGMAEGSDQYLVDAWYQISYVGGTSGADVTLTRVVVPTDVWTDGAGTGRWSNPGNWSLGVIPQPGEEVVFNTSGDDVDVDSSSIDIGSLTLDNTTLEGNTITVEGNFTNTAGNSVVNDPITLTHDTTVDGGSGSIDFQAPIADGGNDYGITVLGGTLGLGVADTRAMSYTGTTEVETGATLQIAVPVASPIVLDSGSTLTAAGPGDSSSITSNGGTINVVSPYNGQAQQLDVPGTFTLDPASTLSFELDSTSIGDGDTSAGYGQIVVNTGTVTLAGTLQTMTNGYSYVPPIGSSYTIIANNTGQDVTGTFNDLPQGGEFESNSTWFRINYHGGSSGHDVVITAVTVPAIWTGTAGDNEWFTAGNWLADAVPNTGQDVIVDPATDTTIDIASPVEVGTMLIGHATLTNSEMIIDGNVTVDDAATLQSLAVLNSTMSVDVPSGSALSFAGLATEIGNRGMHISGGGNVSVLQPMTITGGTTVDGDSFLAVDSIDTSPLTIDAGSTLRVDGNGNGITSNGGTIELFNGGLYSTDSSESGSLTLDSETDYEERLDGSQINSLLSYGQLAVTSGQITLGNATLSVNIGDGGHSYAPVIGTIYTLIANTTGNDVNGTFANLPQGATFQVDGYWMQIDYHGGTTGRDVALTAIKAPTQITSSSLQPTATVGDDVHMTATVTGTDVNGDSPTGSVSFYDGSTLLGTALLSSGTATFDTTALPVGMATINSVYSGDSHFFGIDAITDGTTFTETINAVTSPVVTPPSVSTPVVSFVSATDPVQTSTRFATFAALAADTASTGEAGLTYTWSVLAAPSGAKAPQMTGNGTNAARNMTMRLYKDGTYLMQLTASDPQGYSASRSVHLIVHQTAEGIRLTPHAQIIPKGTTQQYGGVLLDQFNHPMRTNYSLAWKLDTSSNAITSSGLFSAAQITGHVIVEADWQDITGTVGATVV